MVCQIENLFSSNLVDSLQNLSDSLNNYWPCHFFAELDGIETEIHKKTLKVRPKEPNNF